jgi:adenylate kinase
MKEYDSKTKPLLEKYEAKGVLENFEVKRGKKDYPRLKEILQKKLHI